MLIVHETKYITKRGRQICIPSRTSQIRAARNGLGLKAALAA